MSVMTETLILDLVEGQKRIESKLDQLLAGQGRDQVPARTSLSHKEEFQAMLAHRARLDEAEKQRKLRQSGN